MSATTILIIVLIVLLIGGGGYGCRAQWGPAPLGGIGLLIIVLLVLLLTGTVHAAAPTVAELNAQRSEGLEGLLQFLVSIPTSHEAAIFYASLLAMLVGFFASWLTKYALVKTVDDPIIDYFFRSHSRNTLGTTCAYLSTVIGAIATGTFDNSGVFTGWQNVFAFCLTAAMAADGTINKGTQGAWTPAQRAAEREKQAAVAEASK